jgi:hypothetical protein
VRGDAAAFIELKNANDWAQAMLRGDESERAKRTKRSGLTGEAVGPLKMYEEALTSPNEV